MRRGGLYHGLTYEGFAGIPELAKEATDLFIWCLTENPDSYKQWVSALEF